MTSYNDLIEQFLFTQFPSTPATKEQKFEAVSKAVFGSKQRRFGPMPSPEAQVKIRNIIRESAGASLELFLPWGASKQNDGHGMDVMELSAVKQLQCLAVELAQYGQDTAFSFRLEDLTDRYLLGNTTERIEQINEYVENFSKLLHLTLRHSDVRVGLESECVPWSAFRETADSFFPSFYDYLRGNAKEVALQSIGWKGTIPTEQQNYYYDAYTSLGIPKHQQQTLLAKYFAATLTRVKTGAERKPEVPFVLLAFTHPVPGNPIDTPRLHYRSIPERFTNHHRSPWLAKGYFRITEDGTVTPRVVTNESTSLVTNKIEWHGVKVEADYEVA